MKKKRYLSLILALAVGLIISSAVVWPSVAAQKKYHFYVATHATPHPFWDCVKKGAEDAAKLLNVELSFPFMEVYDISKQVEFLRLSLAAKVDGLVVSCAEPTALKPLIKEAREKGIPVVAIDTPDPTGETPYMSYIGADYYRQGRAVGERLATMLSAGDRGVVCIAEPGHSGLEARAKGIKDVLAEVGIETDKLDTGADMTKALEIIRSYHAAHPKIKFISGADAYTGHFAGVYVRTEGLKGKIIGAGFDVSEPVMDLIKKGYLAFSAADQPYAMGFFSMCQLYAFNTAGIVPMNMNTAAGFVDADNVDEESEFAKKGYRG
jgi:simple sugar transport system substrate-binding protein